MAYNPGDAFAEAPPAPPKIRLSEVSKHGAEAEEIWIVRGTRVYDITDWVPNHPGGEVILRAAGGSIDQYWNIFNIHKKQDVYDILEQYFIGVVDERDLVDGEVPQDAIADPFETDPERCPRLQVHSARPCNAETPCQDLEAYITPNEVFYVRNHLWVPEIKDGQDHRVTVELPDGDEREYTVKELKEKFKAHTVTATLQCSGNRRSHMNDESHRPTSGLPWKVGAIGNATWTGALLRDVLADAGFPVNDIPDDINHVQFSGSEAYGASIPVEKAVHKKGDVLLAYQMNGQALPKDHGYPLRMIVPGHVAARSVKWVKRITPSEDESQSQWQQRDYKCFGPNQDGNDVDWATAPAIQEMPVQSAVTSHQLRALDGQREDQVEIKGYALSGGGKRVIRVDLSADGGTTWRQAELIDDHGLGNRTWGWQRWRIAMPVSQVGACIAVKAVDEAYQTQPESQSATWNFRGNLSTAWHRVDGEAVKQQAALSRG